MSAGQTLPRLLCVDDEKNVLEGLTRTLRNSYAVETSASGAHALEILKSSEPFAMVMSDQRMPGMSGVEFLAAARQIAPDSVRILLTGYADLNATIAAVNEGNVFRFLTKPCSTDVLLKSLAACAEQYRLVTSERVLLEQTLRGSVKTLTDILSLTNPAAFGRATRVQQMVSELMAHFEIRERWPVEVAAMLSQIGCVTLPPKTQHKLYAGEPLTDAERAMSERVPHATEHLLANIPRLELVREILRVHTRRFAETGAASAAELDAGKSLPWGARALKIALDFDLLQSERNPSHSLDIMRGRTGWYDPQLLEAFAELRGREKAEVRVQDISLAQVVVGMVFGQDVKSAKGLLLIARGQEVTPSLLERIRNFSPALGIQEPIRMFVGRADAPVWPARPRVLDPVLVPAPAAG